MKPVEQKLAVLSEHLCYLLQRIDLGTHGTGAPSIEKLPCRCGIGVLPKVLEILLEKIASDGRQVQFREIGQGRFLVRGQVLRALQSAPALSFQD